MQKSEEGNEGNKLVKLIMKLKGRISKDEEIPMEMTWCKEPECKVDLVTSEKASIERKQDGTMALKLLKSKRNRLMVTLNVTSDTDMESVSVGGEECKTKDKGKKKGKGKKRGKKKKKGKRAKGKKGNDDENEDDEE